MHVMPEAESVTKCRKTRLQIKRAQLFIRRSCSFLPLWARAADAIKEYM